jgi:hypothetical protein
MTVFVPEEANRTSLISAKLRQVTDEGGQRRFTVVPAPGNETIVRTGKRHVGSLKTGAVFVECSLLDPDGTPVVIIDGAPDSAGSAESPTIGETGRLTSGRLARRPKETWR